MFFKTGALKIFAILTGKHLCWSLFKNIFSYRAPPLTASVYCTLYYLPC